MRILSSDSTYTVAAGRLMRIERASGWKLACREGRLVVTQPGEARDLELAPGDVVCIGTNGRVLVGGQAAASFSLAPPPALAGRLSAILRGLASMREVRRKEAPR